MAEIHFFNYTFHSKYFFALFKIKEALQHANTKEKVSPVFFRFLRRPYPDRQHRPGTYDALFGNYAYPGERTRTARGNPPGDPLSKVRDILGDVYQENVKDFGPFRRVIWNYYGSEFSAVTLTSNTSPSEKLPLHGYTLRGVSFHTPSGFVISMYYDKIKDKYGEATSQTETEDGLTAYTYSFSDRAAELVFDVDQENRVRRIHCRQEI